MREVVTPFTSVMARPLAWSAARTSSTPAPGLALRTTAQAPVTWGADMEVPLAVPNRAPKAAGMSEVIEEPGASSERKGAEFE